MAKRISTPSKGPEPDERRARARAAFTAVVEEIHDEHRVLEGRELWEAVVEIFGLVRPGTKFEEPK